MPWSDQGGGWRGSGGRGPWGQGPSNGGGPGGSPDLEEILQRGQDRLRQMMSGGGSFGGRGALLLVLVVLVVWGLTGFYRVQPDEQGVVLRFGEYVNTTANGLHYHLPYPIETVVTPKVTRVNEVEIGFRQSIEGRGGGTTLRDVPEESLMLTGDENIVDVDSKVLWVISNAGDYLFNIRDPEGTVKSVAESAMREVVGQSQIQPILTQERQRTELAVQDLMQKTLDEYGAGIAIQQVQLQKVDPPAEVIDSFRDVQAARADQERLQNEAEAYSNRIIPEARGKAAQITEAAEAYRNSVIAESRGHTSRFNAIYDEYAIAPDVTRKRMYLETIERVFADMDKIIISDQGSGSGVVQYLPLNELLRARPGGSQGQGNGQSQGAQ